MRVVISCLKAVSTQQQANLIKTLIEESGYEVVFKSTISGYDIRDQKNVAFLVFTLATVPFLGSAVFPYIYAKKTVNKPFVVYVTVEGIPTKTVLVCSNIPKLEFIANSHFTKECLSRIGLKVLGVVPHAIDVSICDEAISQSIELRKQLETEYKDKCKILYVGRHDPRKRLDLLSGAIDILNEKRKKDYVVLLHTDAGAQSIFSQENAILRSTFGSVSYLSVLTLMAACDFLVFPSVCEGFGLPVLEANSVGIPAIHAWYPPLSEFSSKDFNFVFDYTEEKQIAQKNSQMWVFHNYPPEALADMMNEAIDTWKRKPKQYAKYCDMAKEHSEKFDYKKTYKPLLNALSLTPTKTKLEEAKISW